MKKFIFNHKWYIVFILALIIIEPTVTSWLYFWLQKMYNTVQIGTDKIIIIRLITIGGLIWLLKRLLVFTTSVVKSRFVCNVKQDLKHEVFVNILNLNTANISEIALSGEYISLFTNDITIIEQRFFANLIGLLSSIFSLIILGSSFFALDKTLATLVFAFGITVIFIPVIFSKKLEEKNYWYSEQLSVFTQKIKEYLQAYSTIKNYSIEKVISKKFTNTNTEVENSKFEADYTLALADNVGSLMSWFMQIIVIGSGLVMVADGKILLGTVIAALAFAEDLATPLQGIISNINSIRSVRGIVKKIGKLSVDKIKEKNNKVEQNVNLKELDIIFKNLTLKSDSKKFVNDFSFTFKNGKKYLIIGKNGSGKSSIFKALKKRFSEYEGDIYIGGTNIKELSNLEISALVSYLNENVSIFTGTIDENISLFREYNKEDYETAIKTAKIEFDANRKVSEDGIDISSGEQRKIEIARSLLSAAKIMIFDEVVSTLDVETAYEIEKMVLGYEEQTMIFISHNFSGKLIKEYDEILIIDNGQLLAHGHYDELIKNCEYFKNICEIKFG